MNLNRYTEHLLRDISEQPWRMKVEHKPEYSLMSVESNDGSVIAEFDCCEEQWSNEEGYFNAALIAAAPRLYDCLYKLYKDYILPFGDPEFNIPSDLANKIVEALNMAVGQGNNVVAGGNRCGCPAHLQGRRGEVMEWRETSKEWNYRECSAPHCGNCKHFERIYEDCYCRLQDALEDDYNYANIYPDEGGVCDKWEEKK